MRCDEVMVNLPDYILGKVEPNLKRSIEIHLEYCADCASQMEEIKEPIRVLGEAGREEYPDFFWQGLHAAIMERVEKPARVAWKMAAFAGALAALLVIVGIGVFQMYHGAHQAQLKSIAALATSLPPDQAVALPSMNINYVDVVSSQANEIDEMDAMDDSTQQAVVGALWSSVSDSTATMDAFDYLGNSSTN